MTKMVSLSNYSRIFSPFNFIKVYMIVGSKNYLSGRVFNVQKCIIYDNYNIKWEG